MVRPPLKVLFVISSIGGQGGAERFALALTTHLPRNRIEPWMCFTRDADEGALQALRAANVPYITLGRRGRWDSYRLAGLLRLLRRERFDVLHSHMFGSNVWGTAIGHFAHVPVLIAHEHVWSYQGNPLRAWVDRRLIGRLATRFVAVSQDCARQMIFRERVPAEKVMVMPTAYVPRSPVDRDIRSELGIDGGTPLIATAAVLRPQKAIEVLLDAHALLLTRIPAAQLVIAGDGPQRQVLEAHARQLRLNGSVHFVGVRDDIDGILRKADVATLSSDFEGMPLFALESMANDAPLVATAVGGLRELVDDGRSGILVPPRDPRALAEALSDLLSDPTRRKSLAEAASERLHPYEIDAVACRFADLYEKLTSEARS